MSKTKTASESSKVKLTGSYALPRRCEKRVRRTKTPAAYAYLAFMHIPLTEYANSDLTIRGGHRGEPKGGLISNS
jgi:hypothetical protein